jgi:2-methylcitrate dehydratase PrpD
MKVGCVFGLEIEAAFPTKMSGKLTITARGQSFERKVAAPRGERGNCPAESALRAKFTGLADRVLVASQP